MANKKISGYTEKTALDTTDLFLIEQAAGTYRKVSAPNITSCGQLKFPATQNPSSDPNTLDDYEEGTFTPYIGGSVFGGTGTYSVQDGIYTKIGKVVYYSIRLVWSDHTGTGDIVVYGLPFTNSSILGVASVASDNLTFTGQLVAYVFPSASHIRISKITSGSGMAYIGMDSAAALYISGFYFV